MLTSFISQTLLLASQAFAPVDHVPAYVVTCNMQADGRKPFRITVSTEGAGSSRAAIVQSTALDVIPPGQASVRPTQQRSIEGRGSQFVETFLVGRAIAPVALYHGWFERENNSELRAVLIKLPDTRTVVASGQCNIQWKSK